MSYNLQWIVLYHHKHGTNVYLVECPSEPTLDDLLGGIKDLDEQYEGDRQDGNEDYRDDEWIEVLSNGKEGFQPIPIAQEPDRWWDNVRLTKGLPRERVQAWRTDGSPDLRRRRRWGSQVPVLPFGHCQSGRGGHHNFQGALDHAPAAGQGKTGFQASV